MMDFDLERFVCAQADCYASALSEIRAGRKRSHWMWYVLPQLRGLGQSFESNYYGVSGMEEAKAYLAHPVLGARLREISEALLALGGNNATAVMGYPDDMKLRSCMTLFEAAAQGNEAYVVFSQVLDRYYRRRIPGMELEDDGRDETTLRMLGLRG